LPADPVPALREVTPEVLAAALHGERPATVALVLACLDIPQASAVLRILPPEVRHDAATRLRQPAPPNRDLVNRILRAVLARCREAAEKPPEPTGDERLTRLADLIRALGRDDRREILARLEATDPDAGFKVRKQLYRFTDVLRVDDRTLQGILGELNIKTLAVALKNASDEIKTKVLNNVSKRARDNVNEEMELLGNVQQSQIEQAQDLLVQILQRLDQEGQLSL
jgi:flagellar motor switch protein FliG